MCVRSSHETVLSTTRRHPAHPVSVPILGMADGARQLVILISRNNTGNLFVFAPLFLSFVSVNASE